MILQNLADVEIDLACLTSCVHPSVPVMQSCNTLSYVDKNIVINHNSFVSNESFYPKDENLGRDCLYWDVDNGCTYPKKEMIGRRSCEGIIDDVCLYLKDGRPAASLSPVQKSSLRKGLTDIKNIPPGKTE